MGRAALFLQTAYDGEGGGEAQPGSGKGRPPTTGWQRCPFLTHTPERVAPHPTPCLPEVSALVLHQQQPGV